MSPEAIPCNIFYDLLNSDWDESNVTKPTIYKREEVEFEKFDLSGVLGVGTDVVIVYLDVMGESDLQRGNWTYKDVKAVIAIEIHVGYGVDDFSAGQQRLYNLMAEIRRIAYANIHDVSPFHLLRYTGFVPMMESEFGVWSGTCRINLESSGVVAQ